MGCAKIVLRELGAAYRGSWRDMDGRTLRDQLDWIADSLDINASPINIDEYREANDLCPKGYGHWTEFCDEDCK